MRTLLVKLVSLIVSNFFLQTSLQLGSKLLKGLGVMSDDVTFLSNLVRNSMEIQAQEKLDKTGDQEIEVMEPFQVIRHPTYVHRQGRTFALGYLLYILIVVARF